jgi:hypothetical protein
MMFSLFESLPEKVTGEKSDRERKDRVFGYPPDNLRDHLPWKAILEYDRYQFIGKQQPTERPESRLNPHFAASRAAR